MCNKENPGRPEGEAGRNMLERMNSGAHEALAEWGLSNLKTNGNEEIIEIGCGGGANIARLLKKCPHGTVMGVDYSEVSVEVSSAYNEKNIEEGRANVQCENVLSLSFDDESFDLATAFETIYFWPDIQNAFKQVYRVLKKGGRFFICNEADGDDPKAYEWEKNSEGLKIYKIDEIKSLLLNAGFSNIVIDRKQENAWICFTAEK